ncbi:MAG: M15 family metallopeptidase [Planctomycetota bacterium]
MPNFYDTTIRNSKAYRSDAVCKDLALLEPGTRAAVTALLAEAHADGIDLRVLETYRSQTRQSALFTGHRTQLRTVGCHGYGVACDFGVFVDGKYQESNGPYVFLRQLARKHGLISGQDWGHPYVRGFIDSGHVQRVPVWRQPQLFADAWYPPADYDPYEDSAAHGHADVAGALGVAPPHVAVPARSATPSSAAHAGASVWDWLREHL